MKISIKEEQMAIYKSEQFHIDIERQDYPDADCKFMITLWHTPKGLNSRELIAVGLTDNMPKLQSTRNKGNVVESVTLPQELKIPDVSEKQYNNLKKEIVEMSQMLKEKEEYIKKLTRTHVKDY
jgi:hypothetical protein